MSHSLLLLLPSTFPSIRVFSNESVFQIRWPKYWNFSISPSKEYSGLISFEDWLVWSPFSPRDSQESSPTPQFNSINSPVLILLYGPTLLFFFLLHMKITFDSQCSTYRANKHSLKFSKFLSDNFFPKHMGPFNLLKTLPDSKIWSQHLWNWSVKDCSGP